MPNFNMTNSLKLSVVFFFVFITNSIFAQNYTTVFETNQNQTATYEQGINYWTNLAASFSQVKLSTFGSTDIGLPLHLILLSQEGKSSIEAFAQSEKPLLFINNAIHAGEPCGVDATMLFVRDLLQDEQKMKWLEHVDIVAIPFYNVGGALQRNSTTRANQNGPEEYGFRGNAKNLDLNRDFIKADSKNAQSFNQLFAQLQPDVFIDNHTTNGADYQYVMSLISSMKDIFWGKILPFDKFDIFLTKKLSLVYFLLNINKAL